MGFCGCNVSSVTKKNCFPFPVRSAVSARPAEADAWPNLQRIWWMKFFHMLAFGNGC
jgi:hypothetical protein